MALKPATANYGVSLALGGQTMQMTASTEITQEGTDLVVTDRAKTPMGEAVDTAVLDSSTLTMKKRSVTQGPMTITFDVKDGKATGEMKMGGEPQADRARSWAVRCSPMVPARTR